MPFAMMQTTGQEKTKKGNGDYCPDQPLPILPRSLPLDTDFYRTVPTPTVPYRFQSSFLLVPTESYHILPTPTDAYRSLHRSLPIVTDSYRSLLLVTAFQH